MAKKSRLSEDTFKFAEDMAASGAPAPASKAETPDAAEPPASSATARTAKKQTTGTKKTASAKKTPAPRKTTASKKAAAPKKTAATKKPAATKKTTPAKKTASARKTTTARKPASAAGVSGRTIYVKYRVDGTIVSMVEVIAGQYAAGVHPFVRVEDDEKVVPIVLPEGLSTKRVGELRSAYRVETSGTKPSLVLKN